MREACHDGWLIPMRAKHTVGIPGDKIYYWLCKVFLVKKSKKDLMLKHETLQFAQPDHLFNTNNNQL